MDQNLPPFWSIVKRAQNPGRIGLFHREKRLASRRELPAVEIAAALSARELAWQVVGGAELTAFIGDADVLTDDFAPVDQLLTPYG